VLVSSFYVRSLGVGAEEFISRRKVVTHYKNLLESKKRIPFMSTTAPHVLSKPSSKDIIPYMSSE
jgi:hypothetical protein